jgi:hypothetical protein
MFLATFWAIFPVRIWSPVAEVLGLGFYLINQKLKPDRAWVFG